MGSLFVSVGVFFLLTCSGCLKPASQQCANGVVCPAGLVCEEARQECLPPSQLAACDDVEDGADCSSLAGVGNCFDGICVPLACGDGEIRDPEVCDDGNRLSDDGCASDCLSDESCGNLIVDFEAGETCDDGSFLSGDGCSSACQLENPGWTAKPTPPPTARQGHAMTYDLASRRALLFGGFDGDGRLADTWQWGGKSWSQLNTNNSPSAREEHAMSYDAISARVFLFGGYSESSGYHNDSWELEGSTWSRVSPTQSPSGRSEHALVYDAGRESILLFGGKGIQGALADTWLWTGSTWQALSSPTSPSARFGHALAYDIARDRVILFGGINDEGTALGDTWQWDGTQWSEMSPSTSPEARHGHAMTYDASEARVVLYGGQADTSLADVWSLEDSAWVQRGQAPDEARHGHILSYDPILRKLLVFGGRSDTVLLADTWLGDAAGFLESTSNQLDPTLRVTLNSAYDAARRKVVVLSSSVVNGEWDVLEWDGEVWETISPDVVPEARVNFALVYDPVNREVLLFGGVNRAGDPTPRNDIWAWNGETWSERTPLDSPPPRSLHALAYDAARNEVILFGGQSASEFLNDTWAWNGTTWRELQPNTSPSPRFSHSMTYSPRGQNVVLYGGVASLDGVRRVNAETWLWDGQDWSPMVSEVSPEALAHSSLVYYAPRQSVWLMSADTGAGSVLKVWESEGKGWKAIYLSLDLPSPVSGSAAIFDASRGEVVMVDRHLAAVTTIRFQDQGDAERCSLGGDFDHDGKVGCQDPDCWAVCTPNCLPGGLGDCDGSAARCGDMSCDTSLENDLSCPMDCSPSPICGDYLCDDSEMCSGDCL